LPGEVVRVRRDDIQHLAGEDGVDRLAVAVGEAFQGQDLEAGDPHFQVGQAEEFGDGAGEVGAPETRNQKPERGASDVLRSRQRHAEDLGGIESTTGSGSTTVDARHN